jgi:hypothetical protein
MWHPLRYVALAAFTASACSLSLLTISHTRTFPDGDQSQPDGFAFGVTCTPEQKVDGPYTRQDHCIGPFSLGLSHAGKDSLV